MLFNSVAFALFLPITFILHWYFFSKKITQQNFFLMLASYIFYAWWDFRFLFLLIFSTFLDFYTGGRIEKAENKKQKKAWLFISIFVNLGFLMFFKYYNFFTETFVDSFSLIGLQFSPWILKIALPIGISFYTFHGMSYVFDIYYGLQKPVKNYIDYSLFVCFFPLLVAGPIERAHHLLPQVQIKRNFNYVNAVDGLRQILWGLFKKMVVADSCAIIANDVFANYNTASGSSLFLGAVFFAFQIYGDFSGYSDIALGTARLFGFELLRNFSYPYFARDIAEFWRSWHISLTTWFRDYLYFPLGGSRQGKYRAVLNTLIIFSISGFWHGANWTFLAWGLLHAIYFIPLLLFNRNRNHLNKVAPHGHLPSLKEVCQMSTTFIMVVIAWIFFRSPSLTIAFSYIKRMFSKSLFTMPQSIKKEVIGFIVFMLVLEWFNRNKPHALTFSVNSNKTVRWAAYYVVAMLIFFFAQQSQTFIYFQF